MGGPALEYNHAVGLSLPAGSAGDQPGAGLCMERWI